MDSIFIFFRIIYFIAIVITLTLAALSIIFAIRVWKIVGYHYYKIKDEERAKKIKREYRELIQEEKKTEIIEEMKEPEEPKKEEIPKEEKTLKEKVNNFLFRE